MNKKFKYVIVAMGMAVLVTGCGAKEIKKDQPVKEESKLVEELEDEKLEDKKITIENSFAKELDEADYKYIYDDGNKSEEQTIFTANFPLKLEVVSLEFDQELKEVKTIEEYSLEEGDKVLIKAVYPEGIPMLKLKWEVDGKEDEYILQYDGKDETRELLEFKY